MRTTRSTIAHRIAEILEAVPPRLETLARTARPWLGRIVGMLAGAAGGWFGMAAGLLLGWMLDLARAGRLARAYLRKPTGRFPDEPTEGLLAAAALALRRAFPGEADLAIRKRLFEAIAVESLARHGLRARGLSPLLDAALGEDACDLPGLERDLASRGSEAAKETLACFAWGLARSLGRELSHANDESVRMMLADAGCGPAAALETRSAVFPAYREAWELLGISPGASRSELRHAYRARCREVHPDLAGEPEDPVDRSAAFRELSAAYDFLQARIQTLD